MSECSSSSECDSEISGAYKQLGLSAGATVAEVAVGFDQKLRQLADKDINNLCFNNLFTDPSKQLSQLMKARSVILLREAHRRAQSPTKSEACDLIGAENDDIGSLTLDFAALSPIQHRTTADKKVAAARNRISTESSSTSNLNKPETSVPPRPRRASSSSATPAVTVSDKPLPSHRGSPWQSLPPVPSMCTLAVNASPHTSQTNTDSSSPISLSSPCHSTPHQLPDTQSLQTTTSVSLLRNLDHPAVSMAPLQSRDKPTRREPVPVRIRRQNAQQNPSQQHARPNPGKQNAPSVPSQPAKNLMEIDLDDDSFTIAALQTNPQGVQLGPRPKAPVKIDLDISKVTIYTRNICYLPRDREHCLPHWDPNRLKQCFQDCQVCVNLKQYEKIQMLQVAGTKPLAGTCAVCGMTGDMDDVETKRDTRTVIPQKWWPSTQRA